MAVSKMRHFEVVFDVRTLDHIAAIDRKYHSLIRREIEDRLVFEPDAPTRNRKPLTRGTVMGDTWEVRCGPSNSFRIFYDVHRDQRQVVIIAIARKVGNALFVGKERFEP